MKLSEIKSVLPFIDRLVFQLPDGNFVPEHFHVTEIGKITKEFIDCGGVLRSESYINFQLWEADDYDHSLAPKKLTDIIALSEKALKLKDAEVEIEYQGDTIGRYDLDFDGKIFLLRSKFTDCLAREACNIPEENTSGSCGCGSGGC